MRVIIPIIFVFIFRYQDIRGYQKLIDAAIHPVTGDIIPRFFRVSAIAPVNIPIVFAMLSCPASNVPLTLFLHWFNQSYNTACNYANRSGDQQSLQQTIKAYLLAVSSACTFAYGLGKVMEKLPLSLRKYTFLIPCVATASANVSNIAFTRMNEITHGTSVFDDDGQVCFIYCCECINLRYVSVSVYFNLMYHSPIIGIWFVESCWLAECIPNWYDKLTLH